MRPLRLICDWFNLSNIGNTELTQGVVLMHIWLKVYICGLFKEIQVDAHGDFKCAAILGKCTHG